MKQAINKHLVKALVDFILFLEFSDEEVINPDVALQVMEQLSSELLKMDTDQKMELVRLFQAIADSYEGEKSEFILELGENLGLDE